jgi:glycosyltransferase involved in cell wall biosynthesis
MTTKRQIFIAGNGPSLREVDFDDLRKMDWLGMNAAYRHWDRIGVYPRIYSCLDKVVVKSHATEILRMHDERKVDKFFLVKDILEVLPDFPQDDRVFFLEDMVQSTAPGSEIFKTAFSDKKTTGSWAVRFAIFLGYRDIYLGGIDASYVEIISEAQQTGVGLELKIGSEVSHNPNYFFNDYQKPGDTYQIPNPERHFGNLHLQSFEAMNVDIARLGLDITIRNTARGSQLHRFGVYAYKPLKEALRSPTLQAVAVPLTMGETGQFIRNLALWDLPAFHPLRLDSPLIGRIPLHLFFDGERDEMIVDSVRAAFAATAWVWRMFSSLRITFLAIPKELNNYIRDRSRIDVPRKMGPNLHFLAMIRKCRDYRYTQLLETDCVPAKADWLTDLDAACGNGSFWIAGAYLDALGTVNRGLSLQINGNALYATGDPNFIAFMAEVFEPALRYLILEKGDFSLAYDCLVSRLITHALASSVPRSGVKLDPVLAEFHMAVQANLDRFRFIRLYRNISHIDGEFSETALLDTLDGEAVIVHSRRLTLMLTNLIERLRVGLDRDVGSGPLQRRLRDTFIRVWPGDIYAFHYYSNLDGCTFDVFDRSTGVIQLSTTAAAAADTDVNAGAYVNFKLERPTVGKTLKCRIELIGDAEHWVLLRFARNGTGRFVEKRIEAHVVPGSPKAVELSFVCPEDYAAVRLQLKPIGGASGRLKATFRVDDGSQAVSVQDVTVDSDAIYQQALYEHFRFVISATTGIAIAPGAKEPPFKQPLPEVATVPLAEKPKLPSVHAGKRILIIDSTPVGRTGSATGQLKSALLEGWPEEQMLQVWEAPGHVLRLISRSQTMEQPQSINLADLMGRCEAFRPDIIYVRPTESLPLLRFASSLLYRNDTPAVVHIMDDWSERLRLVDPGSWQEADRLLRSIIARSATRLSIGEEMSAEYAQRYGGQWQAVANGIDPQAYANAGKPRDHIDRAAPFVLRYMGGLALDMNFQSVLEVARAVSMLQDRVPLRFDIHTMPWYRDLAVAEMGGLPGVRVLDLVPVNQYIGTLCSADALLIAYNYDPVSVSYIRLSLANKMSECLASGVPLFAYGPGEVATIRYLQNFECADVVTRRDHDELTTRLEALVGDADHRRRLVERARGHALANMELCKIRDQFQRLLVHGASVPPLSMVATDDNSQFHRANQLYRDGNYLKAKALYDTLYALRNLSIYRDNSLSCSRKMSLQALRSDESKL